MSDVIRMTTWCEIALSLLIATSLPLVAEDVVAEDVVAEDVVAEDAKPTPPPSATPAASDKPTDQVASQFDDQIAEINWEEYAEDNGFEGPFARDFSLIEEFPERKYDWQDFIDKLSAWAPANVSDTTNHVRNLLSVCALMDIGQGQFESELPLYVYQRLRRDLPDTTLKLTLAGVALFPAVGSVIETAPELDLNIGVGEEEVRERMRVYAVKMIGRMLGKLPWIPPAQP
jgi:hypothetical protein